jgi:hypothetical protein
MRMNEIDLNDWEHHFKFEHMMKEYIERELFIDELNDDEKNKLINLYKKINKDNDCLEDEIILSTINNYLSGAIHCNQSEDFN